MAPGNPTNHSQDSPHALSAKNRFDSTLHPPQDGFFTPMDPALSLQDEDAWEHPQDVNPSLSDFRESEGRLNRLSRLKDLFENLSPSASPSQTTGGTDQEQEARLQRLEAREAYARELWRSCGGEPGDRGRRPEWHAFERYVNRKEAELWRVFHDIDRDRDGWICTRDLRDASLRAGIDVSPETIAAFVQSMDHNKDGVISFEEWRNFLLLLPRPADLPEIFRFYHSRRPTRIATSVVTQDGDVTMGASGSGWARGKHGMAKELGPPIGHDDKPQGHGEPFLREHPTAGLSEKASGKRKAETVPLIEQDDDDKDEPHPFEGAGRFLLAGGIAGAVSRTATAPFDRLKVYLINESPHMNGLGSPSQQSMASVANPLKAVSRADSRAAAGATREATGRGASRLMKAIGVIYTEGGPKGFFVGNGLNIIKIFPESAAKFLTYETAKRAFAKYVDNVSDQSQISGSSRFVAGGLGGVVSQFAIYPVETLKTRVMSSTASQYKGNALVIDTAKAMAREGGLKSCYRGLLPALVGVFPYSAIDMSTFEALKQAYVKAFGDEPGILGILTFGALSGGVGATSVYPLNLVRTRLQAQGSLSHPQRYTGMRDCLVRTLEHEGVRGLYKGLTPSLLKVVPAVSISWATYDAVTKYLDVGHG